MKSHTKKISKNTSDIHLVDEIIKKLLKNETLEPKHKDHILKGGYKGYKQFHIKPDLLLDNHRLILSCVRLGSHSELF